MGPKIVMKRQMMALEPRVRLPSTMKMSLARTGMSDQALLGLTAFAANYLFAVLYNSQIVKFVNGDLFEYVNRSLYLIAVATFLLGMFFGEIKAASISFVIFAYMATMTFVGSHDAIGGLTNNYFLVYAALATAPVVAYLFRVGHGKAIEATIKYTLIVYLLLYLYFSLTVPGSDIRFKSGGGYIMASDGRGARIAVDAAALATGFFLSVAGLRLGRTSVINITLFFLASLSMYLSSSRQFSFLLIFITALYVGYGNGYLISRLFVRVFVLVSIVMLANAMLDGNVYSYFASDASGYARMQELETIKSTFLQACIFGTGFFNPLLVGGGAIDYSRMVYWNDVGIYGVLFATGIFGLVIFFGLSVLAIRSRVVFFSAGLSPTLVDGLSLSLLAIGFLGFSAPNLWTSGFELLALMIGAIVVGNGSARVRRPNFDKSTAQSKR